MKWAAAPASTCVHAFQNTATVTALTFQSHCRLQKKVHSQNWRVDIGAGAQRAQKNVPFVPYNLNTSQKKRQKLGTFTMKPSMRKDDEKTSPATPSSLKLGLLKCIYTFLFTRTRMHFMQQNVYIHFLSRTRNCVFINTYTKHLYNQSKDSHYLRRAIDGSDLS